MTHSVTFTDLIPSGQACIFCTDTFTNDNKPIGHKFGKEPAEQHEYHPSCISKWFEKERSCPLCKAKVLNAYQYLPSGWKKVSNAIREMKEEIFGRAMLIGTISGITREFLFSIPSINNHPNLISSISNLLPLFINATKFLELQDFRFLTAIASPAMGLMASSLVDYSWQIPLSILIIGTATIPGTIYFKIFDEHDRDRYRIIDNVITNYILSIIGGSFATLTATITRIATSALLSRFIG